MGNISSKLQRELEKVLSGKPWYGSNVYSILNAVTFESAYQKPKGSTHNIAEIVLHMLSWTEEVIDRLNDKPASLPLSGNWPQTGPPNEDKWKTWIDDFKLVNVSLVQSINHFPEGKWNEPIIDERGTEPVTTCEELIYGFIQHQVYHAGQIAFLNSMVI